MPVLKIHLGCCKEGWVVICVGSRFCTPAKAQYHPIEGELLGVAWAFQKMSYYTLGCQDLFVLFDHKPLIGLLENHELGNISNPRLEGLTRETMRWKFVICHIARVTNFGPDALFRYPGRGRTLGAMWWSWGCCDCECQSPGCWLVSWDHVRAAGISDPEYAALLHQMCVGSKVWPEILGHYFQFWNANSEESHRLASRTPGALDIEGRLIESELYTSGLVVMKQTNKLWTTVQTTN